MKIKQIKIANFRCFEKLEINLKDNYTVLLGINGAGKSSVLDAISIALGSYLSGYDKISTNSIHTDDAHYKMYQIGSNIERQSQYPVDIEMKAVVDQKEITWRRSLNGEGRKTTYGDAKEIIDYAKCLQGNVRDGQINCILPIVAYYGTGRLWMQKKEKKNSNEKSKKADINRIAGYTDCLDVASNEKLMLKWFEKMTYVQLQTDEKIPELEAVKKAMKLCYMSTNQELSDVKFVYDVNSNEIEITMERRNGEKEKLPMKSLSDGIKGTISMIADIAYRMAMLNPQLLDKVLETPGVVLIDEVDMHLHPEWQKKIVTDLVRIFPNVQFVLTTHSPSIIANVTKENILILDKGMIYEPQNTTYGRDIDSILKEIMYTDVRPREITEQFQNFYRAIEDNKLNEARQILKLLRTKLGDNDSEIIQAQVYLDIEEV